LTSCPFIELLEPALAALSDKNPNVLKYTCKFIDEGVMQTNIDDLISIKGDLIPALVKLANHSDSEVRDAILESLGLLKGRLTEALVKSYFVDFNSQKQAKVDEAASKYVKTSFDIS